MKNILILLVLALVFVGGGVALLGTHPLAGGVLIGFGILFALLTAGQAVKS